MSNNYDDKMRVKWGFYSDFMKFIDKNTSTNAMIIAPPKNNPWLQEGNAGLDRYFIYPKDVMAGAYEYLPKIDFDYVMIVDGNWTSNNEMGRGWPNVFVPAEKIIYMVSETGKSREVIKDYKPDDPENIGAWGLIKVDKTRMTK